MKAMNSAFEILEEVDDDYGLPTARYRVPTDYANGVLVEDMTGCIWRSVHAPMPCWIALDRPPTEDDDWGILLKPDVFHDPFDMGPPPDHGCGCDFADYPEHEPACRFGAV